VSSDSKRDRQLDSIVRTIVSAARLEFAETAEVGDAGDRIDAIAAGINMLVEELKESVVSKEQLRQSEERYRSLYESSLVGMFRVNISTQRPVAANRKVVGMFGYDSAADFMEHFKAERHYRNPEDRDLMLQLIRTYGELHNYEIEFVRRDGSTFWASCSGKLYPEDGHVEGSIVDISARKHTEDQLKKEKRLAEEHFQSARNIMLVLRPDGTVERINKAGAAALGAHPKEIEGLNWFDNFLSDDCRDSKYLDFKAIMDNGSFPHEFVVCDILTATGEKRTIEWHIGTYTNADGDLRVISSGEDVTRQRLLLGQLQEAQRIARIGHWALDIASKRLDWSEEMFRLLEIEPDDCFTYAAFLSYVHPEDRELLDDAYWNSVSSRTPYELVHRLQLSNGRIKWVREKCETFYNEEGDPIRSIGTTQDITDSYNLELELGMATTAINNTMSSIFIADLKGQVAYANPASARYWGYEAVSDMIKERPHVMDYWTEDTKGQAEAIVKELMQSGTFTGQGLVGRRADGTTFPVEVNACLMRNSEGVPISMIGSFNDITLSREASSKIMQALIEGQESERKRIALEIHDQLGQDLTGIKYGIHHLHSLIRSIGVPPEQKDVMEQQILSSLDDLKKAIRFTSSLGGRLYPPIIQDAGIEGALEQLVGQFQNNYGHIRFNLTVGPSIPEVDDRKGLCIYRIVQEGLNNVVKHSQATVANVSLSTSRNTLNIIISDNGRGYPDHYRSGKGIGIKGIEERAQSLSGTVRFIRNQGATIQVTLPIGNR